MKNLLTQHPRATHETYWQHWRFSLRCAACFLCAGMAAVIHAFLPFLFVCTASQLVAKVVGEYCQGSRRTFFMNQLNARLAPTEQCAIHKCTE